MDRALLAAALVLGAAAHASAGRPPVVRQIHVAPDGDDASPGTRDKPLATVAAAQRAARRAAADKQVNAVSVRIHGGTYFLPEPLAFGPDDVRDGLHVSYAAAEGHTPVLSGGRRVTGWKKTDGEAWTAALPQAKAGKWAFRNLWVNGRRATRARLPNADDKNPRLQLQGAALSKDLKTYTLKLPPAALKPCKTPTDVEVMVDGNWAINRKRVASVDPKSGTVVLAPPHRKTIPWNQPRKGRWCYLEGAREFLDQPGEWHLDRAAGLVSYWPLPGEDMAKAQVVAPVLTRLVEVKGTADKPVRNLHFAGLTFAHTDWQIPQVGYFGVQACHHVHGTAKARAWTRIPAAIRWDYAEGCSVRDATIAHMGTCGIELVDGCHRNTLEGNHIFDISANGVMLGGPKTENLVPRDNRIANNHVHATGVEYMGAIGIWVGFAQRALVAHNEVHDTPYTGISLGWQWNPQPTPCKQNTIEANHIYDVMKNLGDGGGIYTLGFQPGTVIRGNHIHDVRRSRYAQAAPNNGMFIDEGSKGFLFERNVIYRTAHQAVRHNQNRPEWHTWKDNHFGVASPTLAPGKIGSALRGAIEAPHRPALEPEQLTVEAWLRIDQLPGGKDTRRWLVSKNANEWAAGHYALCIDGDRVGAYLNIGGGRANEHHAWSDEGALKLRTWHHAAFTYDGKDLKVYLDGTQVAAAAIGKKRKPGRGPLAIGRRQDRYIAFGGILDEARVYSRALSADELKAHATKPEAVAPDKTLVAHWSFDDLAKGKAAIQAITAEAGPQPPYRKRLLGDD